MRFHSRFEAGELGRILVMRDEVEQRALVFGNVVIIWDARKRKGGTA